MVRRERFREDGREGEDDGRGLGEMECIGVDGGGDDREEDGDGWET